MDGSSFIPKFIFCPEVLITGSHEDTNIKKAFRPERLYI